MESGVLNYEDAEKDCQEHGWNLTSLKNTYKLSDIIKRKGKQTCESLIIKILTF